ncbi:MAG: TldD/PmbA family protein [Coriobacteriia bacterium]|nr:TldD/PmbA family protein [Coriobacteriia bacterium]
MSHTIDAVRAIAQRAARVTPADAAEAIVVASRSALTRFAGNRIHQNVAENDMELSVRAVLGTRTGVASTNRFDDDSLTRCAAAAVDAARHAPQDPVFPGLPEPHPLSLPSGGSTLLGTYSEQTRAEAAHAIIGQSEARGLVAAGGIAVNDQIVAVANSSGVLVAMQTDSLRATVLSTGEAQASGWASYYGRDTGGFLPSQLGSQAAMLAERSAGAGALDPGTYTVVLAPEAVADILDFLGYLGFGAKAFSEGSSFLVGKVGTRALDSRVTIYDDALSPGTIGIRFDYEGQPRRRTPLVEGGVFAGPVTDSYFATKLELDNTGHALPAPNPYGPLPLNLEMNAGDTTVEDMIASVDRGVYVTRFHYVNVEDPMKVVLTGMTRDGTFLIENGKLARPVRNLRFTQSALVALSHVGAIGAKRQLCGGEGSAMLAPALLLERWDFTGQTG